MDEQLEHRPRRSDKEVACAKCGHVNGGGRNHCIQCGARLYISCHACGHSNERSAQNCGHCGHRLHRHWWHRVRKRVFGTTPKITPFQILLLIIFVYFTYKVIIYLVEYEPPSYEGG